ncbi:uncharacterized protein LOC114322696 [Camellia sinensis]|uniref:uncharacterized protein LOC114322696 n=1 Tax=Camellia sinensis TaxID=4442 RepID=UPI001035D055|nr:uncharacterized protein LOC114322696 [Camellia sinensis]
MASLKSGVLTKLLEDMNVDDEKGLEDVRKPVLLQIRSIIPVLEEGDFWPNKGFYLKVSDLSHAMYASLPREQDEMILSNILQLGQFIYVQKLEAAYPVPLLRGVMPVPGRRPCDGTPEDILPVTNLVKFLEASHTESIKDKGVIFEKKTLICGLSDSESLLEKSTDGEEKMNCRMLRSLSASKARSSEQRRGLNYITKGCDDDKRSSDDLGGFQRIEPSSFHNDTTDSDSPKSCVSSTQISKRRSWNSTELLDVKKIFDSSVARQGTRPRARSRSACVSPIRSMRYDSSDDNSTSTTRRRVMGSTTKSFKSTNRSKTIAPKINCEETSHPEAMCCAVSDRKEAESIISWDSLPSSLAKLGKDMVRNKDVAVLAAVEALQEACAAEKLIKCLSTYSEFQSYKGDDPQPFIDKFFDLQDDLAQTRQIVQSLTNISPLKTSDTDINSMGSVKEVLNLAVERKKNATSWIKSAMAFDLSPCLSSLRSTSTTESPNTAKKSVTASQVTKPKMACIVRKLRKNCEFAVGLTSEKDNPLEWARGSTLCRAADLANALQDESRRSFMGYVEKFLAEVESKTSSIDSDSKIAGMMYQIKRVNDWLDAVNKETSCETNGSKEGSPTLEDYEMEACGRVRSKIYKVLLKHVERTAMALENINAAGQD